MQSQAKDKEKQPRLLQKKAQIKKIACDMEADLTISVSIVVSIGWITYRAVTIS